MVHSEKLSALCPASIHRLRVRGTLPRTCLLGLLSVTSLGRWSAAALFTALNYGSRAEKILSRSRDNWKQSTNRRQLSNLLAIAQLNQVSTPRWLVWSQLQGKPARRDFRSVMCGLQWALCQLHSSAFLVRADPETTKPSCDAAAAAADVLGE